MSQQKTLFAIFITAHFLSGCASVQVHNRVDIGEGPLFQPSHPPLGIISLRPETRWRPDQKEPRVREQIAMNAIKAVFQDLTSAKVAAIHPFVPWSAPSDQFFAEEKSAGIDTTVFITVEELGPQFYLSIPTLWSTYSDVKFKLRAVRTESGKVIFDSECSRNVGGPFQLRGLAPLQGEMETALRDALGVETGLPK